METNKTIRRTGIHCLIINQTNQYLVLKRHESDQNDPNLWDLPGGSINPNESPTDALIREIKEETNLRVDRINLLGAYTCDENSLQLCAISHLINGELQLSNEHSNYKYLTFDDLIDLKPAGLHLLAAQYFLKTDRKIITYEKLIEQSN